MLSHDVDLRDAKAVSSLILATRVDHVARGLPQRVLTSSGSRVRREGTIAMSSKE